MCQSHRNFEKNLLSACQRSDVIGAIWDICIKDGNFGSKDMRMERQESYECLQRAYLESNSECGVLCTRKAEAEQSYAKMT